MPLCVDGRLVDGPAARARWTHQPLKNYRIKKQPRRNGAEVHRHLMLKLFRVAESRRGWMRNRPMAGSTNLFSLYSAAECESFYSVEFWYMFDGGTREKPWLNSCRFISSFVLALIQVQLWNDEYFDAIILVFDSNRLCHMHQEWNNGKLSIALCARARHYFVSSFFLCSNLSCASGGRMLVLLPTRYSVIVK